MSNSTPTPTAPPLSSCCGVPVRVRLVQPRLDTDPTRFDISCPACEGWYDSEREVWRQWLERQYTTGYVPRRAR